MSVTQKALLASYKVSYRIAKCKKPHVIGETLVLPAAIDMVATMLGESYADQLKIIPLADNTVGRRISDISEDLCDQLIEKVKLSSFALQVDEATDVLKDAHLITYVRYVVETDVREDMLFCKPIEGNTTASEVFNMIDKFFNEYNILWENCVGLCTDGAPSMAGKNAGLQALVRKVAPRASWTHCMIHRQSLVSRDMGEDLLTVFQVIIRVVNFIKNSPLRGRLFAKLCNDMGSEYTSLLYYCEARWLSRSKVLQRVFELKEEIAIFLTDNNRDEANLFYDTKFLVKLAYLVDIFQRLSTLNKSMQGPQIHAFVQKDKVTAFMRKLELWIISLKNNNFDMFPTFKITCLADEIEESKVLINKHLTSLREQFSFYFKDLDMSKYEWIRNPFVIEKYDDFGLTTAEQEMIIDLSSDSTLKQMFQHENNIVTFWLRVKDEFPTLTNKALEILLPFVTSYLCETGFSAVAVLKTKYRSCLKIEKELRTAISSMIPRFDKICAEKQAHPSH
nr:protein FAM200A-like [Parasteatoda tepidariorum]XP_042902277.1 protein FAM200A-like [Parasteatoda tepidariorum]XP_042906149.1 protein FAM200A-like [Parasteatoda tepidariorum]XP_042906152.1 protein FAM200A-like [Parasteatoda tepidariorum]